MPVVYRCVGILTVDVVVFFWSPGVFHSQDSFPSTFRPWLWETSSGVVAVEARRELWARPPRLRLIYVVHAYACEPLQRTYLQRPLLRMSPTARDETSRGRNPENGRRRDFGRRRWHRESGFQHTDRPRPSSPELFNTFLYAEQCLLVFWYLF